MNARITIALVILFLAVVLGAALIAWPQPAAAPTADETVNNAGESFVSENVIVTEPLPSDTVSKLFTVRGDARGSWFFEASFPLQVRDRDNELIGQGIAMTSDNWMTTEFVPFEGKVQIEGEYTGPATLVLMKDNPSGLPENEDAVEFPIVVQ